MEHAQDDQRRQRRQQEEEGSAGETNPNAREDGAELDGDGYWWKDGEIVGSVFDGTDRLGYRG